MIVWPLGDMQTDPENQIPFKSFLEKNGLSYTYDEILEGNEYPEIWDDERTEGAAREAHGRGEERTGREYSSE